MVANPDRYAREALRREVEAVASAAEGGRNEALNRASFAVAQLVKAGALAVDQAEGELVAAAARAGLPAREARTTIRSAFQAAQPRAGLEAPPPTERPGGNGGHARQEAPRAAPRPAPKADPSGFSGTRWEDLLAPEAGEPWACSFAALAERLARPAQIENKADLPAISLATFEAGARGNATFSEASGVILDLDSGNLGADAINGALSGLVYLGHTTPSSTSEAQRWRVLIPTRRALSFDEYRTAAEWLAKRFPEGTVDRASTKPAQAYYTPAARPGYQCLAQAPGEGRRVLDPDRDLSPWAPVTCPELMALEFPPERQLVAGLLAAGENMVVAAPRGAGKSWFASSLAVASACGEPFLRWDCPERLRVLIVDGELPAALIQRRLAACQVALGCRAGGNLAVLSRTLKGERLPDIGTREGQEALAPVVEGYDLIILDNLSVLTAGIENEREAGWLGAQDWLIAQRGAGRSVLAVAHTGKDTTRGVRGSSAREDTFEVVCLLTPPEDHDPAEGCRFKARFTKLRATWGPAVAPFEAWLEETAEGPRWHWQDEALGRNAEIRELAASGTPVRDLAQRYRLTDRQIRRILAGSQGGQL